MKDFFDRVVARAKGSAPTIQPRTPSRFESPAQHLVPADTRAEPEATPADEETSHDARVPADSPRQEGPAPRDVPPAAARSRDRADDLPGGAPKGLPLTPTVLDAPAPTLAPAVLDAPAPTLAPGRPPALAAAEPVSSPMPAPPSGATSDTTRSRPRAEDPSGSSRSMSGLPRTVRAARPEPESSSGGVPAASGAERSPAPARSAWDVIQEIYSPSVDRGSVGEPPSQSTPTFGEESEGGQRGATAQRSQEQGPREITIAIDRIDVRGLAPAPRPAPKGRPGPRLTLSEYMRQHGQGKR